jgi:hypothetical protein
MILPEPPAWIGTPDLSPAMVDQRADTAMAYLRSIGSLGYSLDDRIRILAHMLAMECARAPALQQAFDGAAYAGLLMGYATAAAWHGKVAVMLATPQGCA